MILRRNTLNRFLTVIILLLTLGACTSSPQESKPIENVTGDNQATQTVKAPEETKMKGETARIQANTQFTYKDLKIGTGNFWEEEYTNDKSETIKGLTAGLWIYVKDNSQEDRTLRAFPGMKIDVAGYQIFVTSVFEENGKQFVELVIDK